MDYEELENLFIKAYGKRCKDYHEDCRLCEAWEVYDELVRCSKEG